MQASFNNLHSPSFFIEKKLINSFLYMTPCLYYREHVVAPFIEAQSENDFIVIPRKRETQEMKLFFD